MDGPCHELLTGSTLSLNQNCAARRSYRTDRFFERIDCRATSDDIVHRITAGGVAAESLILATQFDDLRRAPNRDSYLLYKRVWRFLNVVKSACFDSLHGGIEVARRSNQDNSRLGRQAVCVLQHLDAINLRHLNVGDDHVVASRFHLSQCSLAGAYRLDFVPFLP